MANVFQKFFAKKKYNQTQTQVQRGYFGVSAGVYVNPETSKQVAAFYRGLVYISTLVARLPLEIKDKSNNDIENGIFDLLNISPNDEMSAFTFKSEMIQMAILSGNGFAEIERDIFGKPIALWPIYYRDRDFVRDPEGKLWLKITGGSYALTGQDAYIPYRDVFNIKNFITVNGVVGESVISFARDSLGIALGADTLANALYANGGMPSGVLSVEGTLSDDAYSRVKEAWEAAHKGKKAGGTAILEQGMKYAPTSFAPDVMQFLQSRKFSISEIARWLGVTPDKLYDSEFKHYDKVEHDNMNIVTDSLAAWCSNFQSEVDIKLLDRKRTRLRSIIDLYEASRGDMGTRATYFTKMMQNACIQPNEVRLKEGLKPYEGGSRFFIATNNFSPLDRIDEIIDSNVAPSQVTENNANVNDDNSDKEADETDKELNALAVEYLKKRI